jgi:hypothetical protein
MIKALPAEIEVTLITTAPQPRMVVRPTLQRDQLLRGVNGFAPEQGAPRFTDALVEYSKRVQKEVEDTKKADSLPVLVMVSTTTGAGELRDAGDLAGTELPAGAEEQGLRGDGCDAQPRRRDQRPLGPARRADH